MTRAAPRAASQRQLRIGAELHHALAWILERGDLRDPELMEHPVTVTEVQMSPDLRQARVFVVAQGGSDAEPAVAALQRARGFLRRQINEAVRLKFSPELTFAADPSFETADRIERLLRQPAVMRTPEDEATRQDEASLHPVIGHAKDVGKADGR